MCAGWTPDGKHEVYLYGYILDRSFLMGQGIKIDFESKRIEWDGIQHPFRPHEYWCDSQCIKDLLLMQPYKIQQAETASKEDLDFFPIYSLRLELKMKTTTESKSTTSLKIKNIYLQNNRQN